MLNGIVNVFWGWHVLILILLIGIEISIHTGFFQIRHCLFWLKTAVIGPKKLKGGVSQFQALTAALGGSIGTGNIVGVATAITMGGPGAIFWMWVSAIFGMMTIFAENYLATKYKNAPGALGYIEKIHKIGKGLAIFYAVGCVLASLGMGNMVQSHAAATALGEFGVPKTVSAIVMAVLLFFVARGGLKSAVKISEKLVPLMTITFMLAAIGVLWVFRGNISGAFQSIFEGAFSLKAGAGGVAGMLIAAKAGLSRGIFTNEAGLGSSAFAYDEVKGRSPLQIGCMGIFQVFVDTILMCTLTGLCILCCYAPTMEGAQMTFYAFEMALGSWGNYLVSLCTALFAFATSVTWCCYGREGLFYLTHNRGKTLFAILFAGAAMLGSLTPLDAVFQISDAFNGMMAIPNILALFYLMKEVGKGKHDSRKLYSNSPESGTNHSRTNNVEVGK